MHHQHEWGKAHKISIKLITIALGGTHEHNGRDKFMCLRLANCMRWCSRANENKGLICIMQSIKVKGGTCCEIIMHNEHVRSGAGALIKNRKLLKFRTSSSV